MGGIWMAAMAVGCLVRMAPWRACAYLDCYGWGELPFRRNISLCSLQEMAPFDKNDLMLKASSRAHRLRLTSQMGVPRYYIVFPHEGQVL